MTIPLLDTLLPPVSIGSAPNGALPSAIAGFEALLAGLVAEPARVPHEQSLARPGRAKTLIGEFAHELAVTSALPGAPLPPTGKILPDSSGVLRDDGFAGLAIALHSNELGDEPVQSPVTSEALSVLASLPAVAALVPTAPVVPAPVDPAAAARPAVASATLRAASLQAASPQAAAVAETTRQATPADLRKTARSEQLAAPIGTAPPAATKNLEPRESAPSAPYATEAPKPAQPLTPSLTLTPLAVQPTSAGAASATSRREPESKPRLIAPPIALEPSLAALVAAPTTLVSANPVADLAPAPSQAPTQTVALPDHRALVEALVRARTERDPGVNVALETREFGAVALRFETLQSVTGERGLQVALSSGDPGFERAVASAAAAQAALTDQSGRNPANRSEQAQARTADSFGHTSGDTSGGRAPSSDPQSQQRSASAGPWREADPRRAAEPSAPGDDRRVYLQPDRRRGSIFA